MRAPAPSLSPTIGAPTDSARSITLWIFSANTSPSAPPNTVKSWLNTKTLRPSTVPQPVTTPSVSGRAASMPKPWARCRASMSSSTKESGSSSRSMRSRAVSFPRWCWRATAASLPACSACSRSSASCSRRSSMGWTGRTGSSTAMTAEVTARETAPPEWGGAVTTSEPVGSVAGADLERLAVVAAGLDLDLARLGLLGDRDGQGEHPGLVVRLEPVGVERLTEHHLAGHRTLRSLLGQDLLALGGSPGPLGADGEDVAFDGDVDRVGGHARQIEAELHLLVVPHCVHRHPLHAPGLRAAAEELVGHAVELTEGVVTIEHRCTSGEKRWSRRSARESTNKPECLQLKSPEVPAYSCTSSTSVPKAPLGCTKATVVPRLPGRGASSIRRPPSARTRSTAAAQSSTR